MALPAGNVKNKRCFSLYIGKDVLTKGKYKVDHADHQSLKIEVSVIVYLLTVSMYC